MALDRRVAWLEMAFTVKWELQDCFFEYEDSDEKFRSTRRNPVIRMKN